MVQVTTGLATYVTAKFAAKVRIQELSFALPITLTTPACLALLLFMCGARASDTCFFQVTTLTIIFTSLAIKVTRPLSRRQTSQAGCSSSARPQAPSSPTPGTVQPGFSSSGSSPTSGSPLTSGSPDRPDSPPQSRFSPRTPMTGSSSTSL